MYIIYTQLRLYFTLLIIILSRLIINCLMFNPSPNSAFASISKPQASTNPKPQTLLSPPDKSKEPQATKTKNIVIKSTSIAGLPEDNKRPQPPKVSAPEGTLLQPQENRATGGGKLQSNRNLNGDALNNAALDAPEVPEREEEQPISAFNQLKHRLFMYTKLQKKTFEKKDAQELLKTFKMLTSDEKARSEGLEALKTPQGRQAKIAINYLHDLKEKQKSWVKHYFSMVIWQLMAESQFLNFEGALQLVIEYLQINKSLFYIDQKFNLTAIIEGCKIKIRNEISQGSISSIKNEPYFKKMVKEISFIKDIIFLQYGNFFKAIKANHEGEEGKYFPKNKWLDSEQFLKEFAKIVWGSFKNIIDSQKKEVKNAFELKILLNGLNIIRRVSPKAFDEKIVIESVLPTFVEYSKLVEITKNLKSQADQFMLHLLLTHPFNPSICERPLAFLRNNNHFRYEYLNLLSERPMRFDKRPMTSFESAIFIEKVLEIDDDYSNFSPKQDQFIFNSVHNILKDNPQRFWTEQWEYTHIFKYIQYLAEEVQTFADDQQDINSIYDEQLYQIYIKISQFAQIIGLLIFPSYSQSISRQRMERLLKNRYVINDFLRLAMRMIVQILKHEEEKYVYEQIDIQPIYDFIFQLIIHDHSSYLNAKTTHLSQYGNNDLEVELFPNYLTKFVRCNTYSANCILALTKLVQLRCNAEIAETMRYFDQLNHSQQEISLSQITGELFKKDDNLRPLAKFVLCLLKYFPNFDNHSLMDCLLKEFKELPERAHPENNTAYAAILQVSLKFVQTNPRSMMAIQQYFDFKFANQYICTALDASFEDGIFNKHMRGTVYEPVAIAVKLLKTMTELYLHEKSSNEGELVPYQIRKLLEAQNKEGEYQITMRSKSLKQYATSYHLVLLAILLSRELNFDYGLKAQYPNLKNDVIQTLINLNRIHLHLKHEINLKVSIFYDKQLEGEVNRKLNVKGEVFDAIVNDPTYLGLQYLISSGSIDFKQKKAMFDRVKEIQLERSTSNIRGKSHFIIVYWKEIQNSKLNIDAKKGWDYVKREVKEVLSFLQGKEIAALQREEQDGIAEILDNLYAFSDLLRESNKEYYIKYFLMVHRIYFDTEFACFNLLNEEHANTDRSRFRTSLLMLFSCRSFVSNSQFDTLSRETQMHEMLYRFLRDILKITYRKSYSISNDLRILEIVEFGLSFLIEIGQVSRDWLEELRRLLVERPQKHSPMLTKEVIILVQLHGRLGENMQCEKVDFGNRDWLLMMNAVEPSARYGSILMGELMAIYEMHPIFFASACHYLASTSATPCLEQFYEINSIRGYKKSVDYLIDILKKAIQAEKPYYCVWMIEVLTEMLMNKSISKNSRVKYCSQIRAKILTQPSIHERIAELLAKVGCPYSQSYANLWRPYQLRKPVDSPILFAEKQELLAYLRLLTFIYFTKEEEKSQLEEAVRNQCSKVEKQILESFLTLLPMVSSLLKDQGDKESLVTGSEWERKLKRLELTRIEFSSVKSSGLRQLSSDKLSQVWKGRSGLQILHEISNIQLASLWTMWISVLRQPLYISIFLDTLDSLEHHFEILLRFLQALKKKMTSLQEGSTQIDKVLRFLEEKVYLNSVEVSKEMLFTNSASLSSSLPLQYQSVKGRLRQSFEFIYCLLKEVFKICRKENVRNFQTFEKQFDRFMRSCKDLQAGYFMEGGSVIEISDHESNRNSVTHSRSITNRSHR